MKKNYLFYLLILGASLLLSNCAKDYLTKPSSQISGIKEAKAVFEANATDLREIDFGLSFETKSTKTNSKSVITPQWDRAFIVENGKFTIFEVPLNGDLKKYASAISRKGGIIRSREVKNVTTKLILKKNEHTGEFIYFITTMVGENEDKNVKDINYTNNRSFTGYIFISNLDGLCVGIYNCRSGIRRRAEFATEKTKTKATQNSGKSEEVIDGTILQMFETSANAYSFGETESCPENCWYCIGGDFPCSQCSTCTPVIVDGCSVCGGTGTCFCCFFCHDYPCSCYPDYGCSYCGSYSCNGECQNRCYYCGSRYCSGSCQSTGGGGGGGTTDPDPNPNCNDTKCSNCGKCINPTKPSCQRCTCVSCVKCGNKGCDGECDEHPRCSVCHLCIISGATRSVSSGSHYECVCNYWDEEGHKQILKSIEKKLNIDSTKARHIIDYLNKRSIETDGIPNQMPEKSHLHAMRRSGETAEEAMNAFKKEIKVGFDEFVTNTFPYDDQRAWNKLGETLHGISDSFCPAHKGFQDYFEHTFEFNKRGFPLINFIVDYFSHDGDDVSAAPTDRDNAVNAASGIVNKLIEIKKSNMSSQEKKLRTQEVVQYWEEKYNENL